MGDDSLKLYEEVLLWILTDKKGTVDWRAGEYLHVIAGAVIAELILENRIQLEDSKRKRLLLKESTPTGERLLDEVLEKTRTSKKPKSIESWVDRIANTKKMKNRIADGLCQKGILKSEESRILSIFKTIRYPEVNPVPEQRLIQHLEQVITSETNEVDARTTILLSLLFKSNLLAIHFDGKTVRPHKKRIKSIIEGEKIGKATQEVIQGIEAALMVAVLVPVIVSSTTS